MSSLLKQELLPHYTYEDYKHWEGRWELIEGVPYAMSPAPNLFHQQVSQNIARLLGNILSTQSIYFPYLPIDWQIADDTVVQPDHCILKGKPRGVKIQTPPVLVIEILSPSNALKDLELKYALYQREQVPYYVIVDPMKEMVTVHRLEKTLSDKDTPRYSSVFESRDGSFIFELEGFSFEFPFVEIW
ncbi:MAG: Uma2 family endonuclease [Leptospira sp.]|nr:Uma2 family endonuclease [Leptospira sp.]